MARADISLLLWHSPTPLIRSGRQIRDGTFLTSSLPRVAPVMYPHSAHSILMTVGDSWCGLGLGRLVFVGGVVAAFRGYQMENDVPPPKL